MTSHVYPDLEPGSLVGSYRVIRELGRGGFGIVYQAVHTILPRLVALKVMHGELVARSGMATRMVLEATALEGIRHPGITRIYDASKLPDGRLWLAMELVDGESLAHRMAHGLSAREVAQLLGDVADVLAAAHARGIVHRDLKPDNILLVPGDRDFGLRLIDWGIARHTLASRVTLDGMMAGTPCYMSPEQTRGHEIGPASDVYSLGILAYEILTGAVPFEGGSIAEIVCGHLMHTPPPMPGVPVELAALVLAMLGKVAGTRPTTTCVRDAAWAFAHSARGSTERPTFEITSVDDTTAQFDPVSAMAPRTRKLRWTPDIAPIAPRETAGRDDNPEQEPRS